MGRPAKFCLGTSIQISIFGTSSQSLLRDPYLKSSPLASRQCTSSISWELLFPWHPKHGQILVTSVPTSTWDSQNNDDEKDRDDE
jgi:hypothetical protein